MQTDWDLELSSHTQIYAILLNLGNRMYKNAIYSLEMCNYLCFTIPEVCQCQETMSLMNFQYKIDSTKTGNIFMSDQLFKL